MVSNIWLKMTKETCCYSPISSKGHLYTALIRQDGTYHSVCNTSCGALAGTGNSWMGLPGGIGSMSHHTCKHSNTELHITPFYLFNDTLDTLLMVKNLSDDQFKTNHILGECLHHWTTGKIPWQQNHIITFPFTYLNIMPFHGRRNR